jgi:hypothetical protein
MNAVSRSFGTYPCSKKGTLHTHPQDFNWDVIDPPIEDLVALGLPFLEYKIKKAIEDLSLDKSPGSDRCTTIFFLSC